MHDPASPNAQAGTPVSDMGLGALKIGFLYNHDELHQLAHTAPIISALRMIAPQLQIDVLTGDDRQKDAVMALIDPQAPPPNFIPLAQNKLARFAEKALGGMVPLQRIGNLAASRDILSRYDALIVPETTSTLLKTRYGLKTKLIFLPHGAGDRSIGVSADIAHFDFVLMPGEKTRDRMIDAGVATAENSALVGYPKFDAFSSKKPLRLFENDKPIVLYNPHFDPKLSSWFRFGEDVLEYFAGQDEFNLILAPHIMLFRRKFLASVEHRLIKLRKDIAPRFFEMPHIHIDLGSERSVDMSYTRMADIYLGDVSSQVYEFMQQRRPAIFLNSHEAAWEGDPNYECWKFGPVVTNIDAMAEALHQALPLASTFKTIQDDAFNKTFYTEPETSAAERGARAIIAYLQREMKEAQ